MADDSTPLDLIFDEDTGTREAAALTLALVDSEDRYRALVEQSLLGLFVTQGFPPRFVLVNRGFAKMTGRSVEELLVMEPEDVVQIIYPEDLEVALSPYRKLLNGNATQDEVTFRYVRSDGSVRWIQAIASKVEFQGAPAVQALTIDITDRVATLEALKRSERRYRLLARNLNDIIWTMDLDFNVMFVSRSEARLRGFPVEEVRSQTLEQRMTPESAQRVRAGLTQALEAQYAGHDAFPVTGEMDMVHANGTVIPTETTVTLLRDDSGVPTGYVGVTRDITRRRKAERERRELEESMQRTQKLESLGVLVGGIAHDFNNLLHAFMTNLVVVRNRIDQESPAVPRLNDMETVVRRAADLCRQMLAYAGRGRVVTEPVGLNHIVREMTGLLKLSAPKKVELRLHLDEQVPSLMADPTQLRQVMLNLVTNGAEAIGTDTGLVTISTGVVRCERERLDRAILGSEATPGRYAFAEVSDTGCGMSTDTVAKMFEPFFSTKLAGRGLGLAAVLGIVRAHRGVVEVRSVVGEGTTCCVLLPLIARAPQPAFELAPPVDLFHGEGETVLVVDDDRLGREGVELILEHYGFRVLSAASGRQAIEVFRQEAGRIAVVLLDLNMPDLDGIETFHELRRIHGSVPVVLCSGYGADDVAARIAQDGANVDGFLHKPYDPATLLAKLSELLE